MFNHSPNEIKLYQGHQIKLENILANHKIWYAETHDIKHDHEIFSRSEFNEIQILKNLKGKAYRQLEPQVVEITSWSLVCHDHR